MEHDRSVMRQVPAAIAAARVHAARRLRRIRGRRPGQGGAATARGHGGQAAGAEADRMGRVHRPVRAGAAGRDPGPGRRATCRRSASRTARTSRPARCCSSSIRAPTRRRSIAPRPRSSTQRAQLTLAQLDQDRTSKLVHAPRRARATLDERNAELAAARASLAGSEAAAAPGRARSRMDPRSPHRSPGGSPTGAWMSAIWSPTRRC